MKPEEGLCQPHGQVASRSQVSYGHVTVAKLGPGAGVGGAGVVGAGVVGAGVVGAGVVGGGVVGAGVVGAEVVGTGTLNRVHEYMSFLNVPVGPGLES